MKSMRALGMWLCAALLLAAAAGCTDYSDKTKAEKPDEGVFEITPMTIPTAEPGAEGDDQGATSPEPEGTATETEEPAPEAGAPAETPDTDAEKPARGVDSSTQGAREVERESTLPPASEMAAAVGAAQRATPDTGAETSDTSPAAAPETPVAAPPGAKVYKFTKDTLIAWEASKRIETHSGGFNLFDGQVIVPDGDITKGQIQITFNIADGLHSDNVDLTKTVKGAEWFDVAKYPTAKFIANVNKTDAGYEVAGNLTLKDKTVGIKFPAEITVTDKEIRAMAEFTINRHDWGISAQSGLQAWGDQMVLDEVLLMFDAHAVAQ